MKEFEDTQTKNIVDGPGILKYVGLVALCWCHATLLVKETPFSQGPWDLETLEISHVKVKPCVWRLIIYTCTYAHMFAYTCMELRYVHG